MSGGHKGEGHVGPVNMENDHMATEVVKPAQVSEAAGKVDEAVREVQLTEDELQRITGGKPDLPDLTPPAVKGLVAIAQILGR